MKIVIEFHEDAIEECLNDNEITYDHMKTRLTRFCNDPTVLKMLLEGTIVDPFPEMHYYE